MKHRDECKRTKGGYDLYCAGCLDALESGATGKTRLMIARKRKALKIRYGG